MASSVTQHTDGFTSTLIQKLDGELICGICLEIFKNPVLLKCGHNFCKECIDQLISNPQSFSFISLGPARNFNCPVCQAQLPCGQGVDPPLANRALESIVTMYKECAPVNIFDTMWNVDMALHFKKCQEHNMDADMFCQSCEEVVCKKCVKLRHTVIRGKGQHNVEAMENRCLSTQIMISELLSSLKKEMIPLNDRISLLKEILAGITTNDDYVKNRLEQQISALMSSLRSQQEELKRQVVNASSDVRHSVEAEIAQCKAIKLTIVELMKKLSTTRRTENPFQKLKQMENVGRHLSQLLQEDIPKCVSTNNMPSMDTPNFELDWQLVADTIKQMRWEKQDAKRRRVDTSTQTMCTQSSDDPGQPLAHLPGSMLSVSSAQQESDQPLALKSTSTAGVTLSSLSSAMTSTASTATDEVSPAISAASIRSTSPSSISNSVATSSTVATTASNSSMATSPGTPVTMGSKKKDKNMSPGVSAGYQPGSSVASSRAVSQASLTSHTRPVKSGPARSGGSTTSGEVVVRAGHGVTVTEAGYHSRQGSQSDTEEKTAIAVAGEVTPDSENNDVEPDPVDYSLASDDDDLSIKGKPALHSGKNKLRSKTIPKMNGALVTRQRQGTGETMPESLKRSSASAKQWPFNYERAEYSSTDDEISGDMYEENALPVSVPMRGRRSFPLDSVTDTGSPNTPPCRKQKSQAGENLNKTFDSYTQPKSRNAIALARFMARRRTMSPSASAPTRSRSAVDKSSQDLATDRVKPDQEIHGNSRTFEQSMVTRPIKETDVCNGGANTSSGHSHQIHFNANSTDSSDETLTPEQQRLGSHISSLNSDLGMQASKKPVGEVSLSLPDSQIPVLGSLNGNSSERSRTSSMSSQYSSSSNLSMRERMRLSRMKTKEAKFKSEVTESKTEGAATGLTETESVKKESQLKAPKGKVFTKKPLDISLDFDFGGTYSDPMKEKRVTDV